jgi:hypothetical protein
MHKIILDQTKALEIYNFKLRLTRPTCFRDLLLDPKCKLRGASKKLAALYGVNPKTIRDIWNRRSWGHITSDASLVKPLFEPHEDTLLRSFDDPFHADWLGSLKRIEQLEKLI